MTLGMGGEGKLHRRPIRREIILSNCVHSHTEPFSSVVEPDEVPLAAHFHCQHFQTIVGNDPDERDLVREKISHVYLIASGIYKHAVATC
jgi:hypothetical protein